MLGKCLITILPVISVVCTADVDYHAQNNGLLDVNRMVTSVWLVKCVDSVAIIA